MTKMIIPETQDELKEILLDRKRAASMIADDDAWGEFVPKYQAAFERKDKGETEAQVREQVEKQVKEILDAQEVKRLPFVARPGAGDPSKGLYNPGAPGAAIDADFKGIGDFSKAIWHRTISSRGIDARLKDFSSVIGADGGFLVPEVLRAQLLQLSLERAVVRPRATVIPMENPRVPFPAIDETSHASSVRGGIIGYWVEESGALTESQASFARVVLDAKKLTAYCEVPNELLADSIISFEAFINRAYPEALAWFEDVGFLRGNGAGQPLGVLDEANASLVNVTRTSASLVVYEDVVNIYARMLPSSLQNFVWLASPDVFPQLATMSLAVGTGGSPVWIGNATGGPPTSILGRPVIFTEKVPALASADDIMAADLSYYLVGDRQAMSAMSSPHFKFQNDQTAFRFIERVDGRPWLLSALTPRNGGASLSAFVGLAA